MTTTYVLVPKDMLLKLAKQPLSSEELRVLLSMMARQGLEINIEGEADGEPTV